MLGKGTLAIHVAEWFRSSDAYVLGTVVPVTPEPTWTESLLGWARSRGVPAIESGDYRELAHDRPIDLAVSVFYDRILAPDFIARCGRILNVHNGPLPRYRGVSPINWALKNGETTHGVTIHEVTSGIDEGPVVAQLLYSIYPASDEVGDVYRRALAYGRVLFEQTMPILHRITPRPQDESEALHYRREQDAELGDRRLFTRAESSRPARS